MLRRKQEKVAIRVPGSACEEAIPGRSARSRYPAAIAWGQPETALVVNFFNRISEEQVVLSLSGEECQRPTSN